MKKKTKLPLPLRMIRWTFPKVESISPTLAGRWAWKLFFEPIRFKSPQPELDIEKEANMYRLQVDHMDIQVYEWGHGDKTIFVLHGWAGRATQFRKFIPKLNEAGYRVVGIDGPSHGKSSGKRTHIMEFAKVLKELHLRYPEVESVIAHSFGGAATMMAVREGLKIKRLINIGTPTDSDYIINDFLRRINGHPESGAKFKEKVLRIFNKPFSNYSVKESIKHIKEDLSVLLIHDHDDKEVPVEHAIELANDHPEIQLKLTKGLGHMRILKDPEIIKTCIEFVEQMENEKLLV